MNEHIIETHGLSFAYFDGDTDELNHEEIPALKSVDLSFNKGEYVAVLGHNGSGKSTLAKLMNLILIPTSGKIFVCGMDVSDEDLSEDDVFEVRKRVGMVFQNPDNQIVATVVEEDVAFGVENLGLPREEIIKRVSTSLDLVGMKEYIRHAPHKLSGGQKQRVAIAGVIAMKPEVIIFDESTAMLDPIGRKSVLDIMEKLNRDENITVINITHYMEEAARADRVIVINDGSLILDGTPKDVFSNVELLHSLGLESPQSVELVDALNKSGVHVGEITIGEEECAEAIYRAILKKAEERK